MMVSILHAWYYLGADATTLGIGSNSSLVVLTASGDKRLTSPSLLSLRKAGNYVCEEGLKADLPRLEEMLENGLSHYSWSRARGGSLPRSLIEHAALGNLVYTFIGSNRIDPRYIQLYVDSIDGRDHFTRYLLSSYLGCRGIQLGDTQITIYKKCDTMVPLVNYADLLAFQIGSALLKRYSEYHPHRASLLQRFADASSAFEPTYNREHMTLRDRALILHCVKTWTGRTTYKRYV